jgi:hypothetical protein
MGKARIICGVAEMGNVAAGLVPVPQVLHAVTAEDADPPARKPNAPSGKNDTSYAGALSGMVCNASCVEYT